MIIQVGGPEFQISAAHFLANADFKEPLHGHNYLISAQLTFSQLINGMAADFRLVQQCLRRITQKLDQRILLAAQNSQYQMIPHVKEQEIEICYQNGDKKVRYIFPDTDVVLLPCADTTTENLALFIQATFAKLWPLEGPPYQTLAITVEEAPGKSVTTQGIGENN